MEPFKPPDVETGQIVWYWMDTKDPPSPAIVFGQFYDILHLRVFNHSDGSAEIIRGVRHRDDPKIKENMKIRMKGWWDISDRDKELNEMLTDFRVVREPPFAKREAKKKRVPVPESVV